MLPSWVRKASLEARSPVFIERRPFLSMWTGGGLGAVGGDDGVLDWRSGSLTLVAFGRSKSCRNLTCIGLDSQAQSGRV